MKINTGKTEPAARPRKLVAILGIAILAICLSAGVVQAVNAACAATTTAPDGSLADSIVSMAGLQNGDTPVPGAGCGEHTIACYDASWHLLGKIDNAPCYWVWSSCEEDKATDFQRCARAYSATRYVQRLTACTY